jgi:hypothetical protein
MRYTEADETVSGNCNKPDAAHNNDIGTGYRQYAAALFALVILWWAELPV